MTPSPEFQEVLNTCAQRGASYPERVLIADYLATEGSVALQYVFRKQTTFLHEEQQLSPDAIAGLIVAIQHDGGPDQNQTMVYDRHGPKTANAPAGSGSRSTNRSASM